MRLNSTPNKRLLTNLAPSAFLTSAGYASASAMFSLVDPPFTFGGFAISQFEVSEILDA